MSAPALSWTSSDTTVATVDQNGSIKAVRDGAAVVTVASATNVHASLPITVRATISLTARISSVTNATLGATKDTLALKLVVTDR